MAALAGLGTVALLAGCGSAVVRPVPNADPARGKQLIGYYGCGTCHVIGGIASAQGRVGPALPGLASRATIAGKLANTPANLIRWIEHPQQIDPGTDMPDLGIGLAEARDIAGYLYSQ